MGKRGGRDATALVGLATRGIPTFSICAHYPARHDRSQRNSRQIKAAILEESLWGAEARFPSVSTNTHDKSVRDQLCKLHPPCATAHPCSAFYRSNLCEPLLSIAGHRYNVGDIAQRTKSQSHWTLLERFAGSSLRAVCAREARRYARPIRNTSTSSGFRINRADFYRPFGVVGRHFRLLSTFSLCHACAAQNLRGEDRATNSKRTPPEI